MDELLQERRTSAAYERLQRQTLAAALPRERLALLCEYKGILSYAMNMRLRGLPLAKKKRA